MNKFTFDVRTSSLRSICRVCGLSSNFIILITQRIILKLYAFRENFVRSLYREMTKPAFPYLGNRLSYINIAVDCRCEAHRTNGKLPVVRRMRLQGEENARRRVQSKWKVLLRGIRSRQIGNARKRRSFWGRSEERGRSLWNLNHCKLWFEYFPSVEVINIHDSTGNSSKSSRTFKHPSQQQCHLMKSLNFPPDFSDDKGKPFNSRYGSLS